MVINSPLFGSEPISRSNYYIYWDVTYYFITFPLIIGIPSNSEMPTLKPIILYSHARGPVPWRVAIILEELNVPYESKYLDSHEMNSESYKSINPNCKTPAIEDLNTGIKLFEVGSMLYIAYVQVPLT